MDPSVVFRDLPFAEAIDYFRAKVNLPTETWRDIWQGMHSRAFVVAQAAKSDLLSDLRSSIDRTLADGRTIADFRKDFDATVEKYGWWYRGGYGFRTRVIFDTNLSVAYAAGKYAQMTDPDILAVFPYWRYVTVGDSKVREEHRKWHNLLLRADDPWWKTHKPPNAFGCRCDVEPMTPEEYDELKGKPTYSTAPAPGEADEGWRYSPGETAWGRPWAKRVTDTLASGTWVDVDPRGPESYGRPEIVPVDAPKALPIDIHRDDEEALRGLLRGAIGGDEDFFTNPFGERVLVTQAVVDHMLENTARIDGRQRYFSLIPEVIEDPYEIWVNFTRNTETGRYALRERYVKVVEIDKATVVTLVAETSGGIWTALTFFRGRPTGFGALRKGRLLWGR